LASDFLFVFLTGILFQIQSMCRECEGKGERINVKDRCKVCMGRKVVKQSKLLEVHIDKGEKKSESSLLCFPRR